MLLLLFLLNTFFQTFNVQEQIKIKGKLHARIVFTSAHFHQFLFIKLMNNLVSKYFWNIN